MFNILMNNTIHYLAQVMITNGFEGRIEDINAQTILSNLRFLAKEKSDGSLWLPLNIKRMLEKVICGYTNTALEFEDGKDVYFQSFGDTSVCVANVYWVHYDETGNRRVLGHGFSCLALDDVMPGEFMSQAKRISLWKMTTIGGAKSRAFYEGGLGLEFYGDVLPEIIQEEKEAEFKTEEKPSIEVKREASSEVTEKPKRGRPRKEVPVAEAPKFPELTPILDVDLADESEELPWTIVDEAVTTGASSEGISEFSAKNVIADCSDLKGKTLEVVMNTNPKRLVYIAKNSESPMVREAARVLVNTVPELTKYL